MSYVKNLINYGDSFSYHMFSLAGGCTQFLDIEARMTDSDEEESDRASYPFFFYRLYKS